MSKKLSKIGTKQEGML